MTEKKGPADHIARSSSKRQKMLADETKRRRADYVATMLSLTESERCGRLPSTRGGHIESKEEYDSLLSGLQQESDHQGEVSEKVADSCKSVVSVALSNGHEVLSSFSGIAIETQGDVARFLTSSRLAIALEDATKVHNDVKVEIRREGIVVIGTLDECDLDLEFAIVTAPSFPDMRGILVDHDLRFEAGSKAIAVGRDASGKLMTTVGGLVSWTTPSPGRRYCMKFYRDWHGGALFDFDGNLIGMNLVPPQGVFPSAGGKASFFKLRCIVRRRFEDLRVDPQRYMPWDHTLGYPEPSADMISCGMILDRTFEEPFGDEYPKGAWNEFSSKRVSADISQNVVALASFNGEKRFFACSGFFIDLGDKCPTILTSANLVRCPNGDYNIVEGLRIDVLLPNGRHAEGSLKDFSLHYNIAIVTIKHSCVVRPWHLEREGDFEYDPSLRLVAVGHCYKSGVLMAASGRQTRRRGRYINCLELSQSTCVISKAGIGGPIVDIYGNIVGMSFYVPKAAVFLDYRWLCAVLHYFKEKSVEYVMPSGTILHIEDDKGAEAEHCWQVPEARWLDPRDLEAEKENRAQLNPIDVYESLLIASGCKYIRSERGLPMVLK